jgi:predicted enzyme related to lactoylglutathione lyase
MSTATTPVLGIHHVGLRAHDAPALAAFYRRAAGLQEWTALQALEAAGLPDHGTALCAPNSGIRVLHGGRQPRRLPVSEAGFTHVCLQSPDFAKLLVSFAESGATFHGTPVELGTGFRYAYARDTEHNVVELEGVAPVWTEPQPWLAHVNVAAHDLKTLTRFYEDLLGRSATRSPRLAADVRLDTLADLPQVALRMAWVPAGACQIELIRYDEPLTAATRASSRRREEGHCGHAYLAFEVDEVEAAAAHVLRCGGSVSPRAARQPLAFAHDPEGNPLWLLDARWLAVHGAGISQLAQPDLVARFELLRLAASAAHP